MKMKGGICVLVGALLVVFSLTMVAEAQRKNRIRGNQGRRSVGNPGTTIQQKRKGQSSFRDIMDGSSNTQLRRDQRGVERNRLGAGATSYPIQRKRTEMMSGSHAGDYDYRGPNEDNDMTQRKRKGQPSLILDDTTNPSLRDNGGVERNRRKRR